MHLRKPHVLILLVALSTLACGGDDDGGGTGTIGVAAVFPSVGYTGATVTVLISGNLTTWSESSAVAFGEGVTAVDVVVVGPSSIMAELSVDAEASAGTRTVTVDGDDLTDGFEIIPSFDVESALGTVAQGSIAAVLINNNNPTAPFDPTKVGDGLFSPISFPNFRISLGESAGGVSARVVDVTTTQAVIELTIDVSASVGIRDLEFFNGPEETATSSQFPAFIDIAARLPEAFTGDDIIGTQSEPIASRLFAAPSNGGSIDIFELNITATSEDAAPQLRLADAAGSFINFVSAGRALRFSNRDGHYFMIRDASGLTGFDYTVKTTTTNVGTLASEPSPEANETAGTATAVALGTITEGTLSSASDLDYFSLTLAEDSTITVFTEPGDTFADPVLSVYESGDLDNPVATIDNDFHEVLGNLDLDAGDYFVVVSQSDFFPYDASEADYNVIIIGGPQ